MGAYLSAPAKPRKSRPPGPTSRAKRLVGIDRRTRAGKIIRDVTAALTADIGGDPSTQERLLIQSVAVKAAKLDALQCQLLDGDDTDADPKHILAWSNSMRLDLVALGLQRRARDLGIPGSPQPSSLRERAFAVVLSDGVPA